jgi:hypothetical protein
MNIHVKAIQKNEYLDILYLPVDSSMVLFEWKEVYNAISGKQEGHSIETGRTKKRLHNPASPNPII